MATLTRFIGKDPEGLSPRSALIRLDRLWLKITPATQISELLTDDLRGALSDDTIDFVLTTLGEATDSKQDLVDIFLPITGPLPAMFFRSKYAKVIPDLGLSQRASLELVGGIIQKTATGLQGASNALGGFGGGLTNLLQQGGSLLSSLSGNLDGPKVWENVEVAPVAIISKVGFEDIEEYQYFKAVEIVLQRMTVPKKDRTITAVKRTIQKLIQTKKGGVLSGLEVLSLAAPLSECSIEITAGVPIMKGGGTKSIRDVAKGFALSGLKSVTGVDLSAPMAKAITDIVPSNQNEDNNILLFSMDDVFLGESNVQHGTENGRGFDATGISRIATFSLNFIPKTLQTVIDGQARVSNDSRFKDLKRLPSFIANLDNVALGLIYNTLNTRITAGAIDYLKARFQNTTGVGKQINTASGGEIKNSATDWGISRLVASSVRIIFG